MEISEIFILSLFTIVSFWISKTLIPVLLLISKRKKLFDDGDDHRKLHDGLIPTLGGVAIFTAFMISFSASSYSDDIQGFGYFVAASILLFGAGLKDDLIIVSPIKKLLAQFIATALIVFGCGIQFTNLGGVFGVEAISAWIGIPLTFYTVIVVINAQNLIDGIDGLGGSIGVFASAFFGVWFYMAGIYSWATFSFLLAGAILGFLWYNRPPAKIFMGDTGSLMIGFFLAILAVNFVEFSISEPSVVDWQPAAPIIAAAVLVVPLYDTLRIFIVRAVNGNSPFEADSDHVHHHLLRVGYSHGGVVIFLLCLNIIILSSIILLSDYLSNTWLLAALLGMSVLFFPTNRWKRSLLKPFVSEEWNIETEEVEKEEDNSAKDDSDSEHVLAEDKLDDLEKSKSFLEV